MPTKRRRKSGTGFYHVVVRGINHERIFNQQREKAYFLRIISNCLSKFESKLYSYCIMSNHAHFIIRAELPVLSMFMGRVLAEYASYYNYKHKRNGHVFQNRFSSECIETESYLWNCVRYIHMNPVKARMTKSAEKYKYSSMLEYARKCSEVLHPEAFLLFSQRFRDYQDFSEFHKDRYHTVFLDITEEIRQQEEEFAYELAKEMFYKYRLPLLNQVFEEKNLRKEYITQLRRTLNTSQRRTEVLYKKVRTKIENK